MKKIRKLIIALVLSVTLAFAVYGSTRDVSARGTVTDLYSVTLDHTSGSSTAWTNALSNKSNFKFTKYSSTTDYFYMLMGSSWSMYLSTPSNKQMKMYFSFSSCTPYTNGNTSVISGRSVLNSSSNTTYNKYTYSFSTTYYKTSGWRYGFSTSAYATPSYYTNTSGSYTFTPTDTIYIHIPIVTKTYNSTTKIYTYSHCVAVYKVVFKLSGYVYGQEGTTRVAGLKFGTTTIEKHGCGLVAAYNAAKLTGHDPNFYTLLKYANDKAMALTYGLGMTNANMQSCLTKAGASYTKYTTYSSLNSALSNGSVFVICVNWDNGGGHFISGRKNSSTSYTIYNRFNENTSTTTVTSLATLWNYYSSENGHFSTGWIVK